MRLRMLMAIMVFGVASCARQVPTPNEITAGRSSALAAALSRAQATFGGSEIEPDKLIVDEPRPALDPTQPPAPTPERLEARVPGQSDAEVLYRAPDGRLALSGATCLRGDSCGCSVSRTYKVLRRDDGRIAFVRLTPVVETIQVEVDDCGYGCGQPSPPRPKEAAVVPANELSQLEVIDAPYRYVEVVETCDSPIARP